MGAQVAKLKKFTRTPTASLKSIDRVLEQKKPAQRHPTTIKGYKQLVKENPKFNMMVKSKNDNLHKMLETVKVDSIGAAPNEILKSGKRARKLNIIPEGKLSLKQIEELFINQKISPELWTVETVAEKYKLDEKVTNNLLEYYSSFYIYKPPKDVDEINHGLLFFQKDAEKPINEVVNSI